MVGEIGEAYNIWAFVGEKLWSLEPIVAAAMTCTAHPQSIEATDAMEPTVFMSAKYHMSKGNLGEQRHFIHPTIQERRFRHLGEDNECVQK